MCISPSATNPLDKGFLEKILQNAIFLNGIFIL